MKIQEKSGQYWVTIPRKLILAKGWKKGDRITFIFNSKGNLELVKA